MNFGNLFYLYVYVFIVTTLKKCQSRDYCDPELCKNGELHTMCKFKYDQPSTQCVGFKKLLTNEDKELILLKINTRRNTVAAGDLKSLPPAVNMNKLVWNEELAMFAQRWANQCTQHSIPDIKDSCRDIGNITVGQNIATIYGEDPGITGVILVDLWFTELLNINSSIIMNYQPSEEMKSSHYDYFTQLVWADTTDVGCGGAYFLDTRSSRNKGVYRLVCNFSPAGNIVGDPVFQPGDTCTGCPNGTNCDTEFQSLCQISTDDKIAFEIQSDNQNESMLMQAGDDSNDDGSTNSSVSNLNFTSTTIAEDSKTSSKEEDLVTFDYFSHDHKFTREMVTKMVTHSKCNNIYDIDNLFEVLKRKLSTDPVFNQMLQAKRFNFNETFDFGYTDENVQAFMSHIYGKNDMTRTTKSLDNDVLNSTLLADLIEAVIFRSGDKFITTKATEVYPLVKYPSEVVPVRIQAELAKVNTNRDFTGHYFFPEDINDDTLSKAGSTETSESTELYYEMNSNEPRSDIVLQLENIRKKAITRDFIEDILESASMLESTTHSYFPNDDYLVKDNKEEDMEPLSYTNDSDNSSDELYNAEENIRIKRNCGAIIPLPFRKDKKRWTRRNNSVLRTDLGHNQECNSSNHYLVLKYDDLIEKLARDINIPELNESMQCFLSQANHLKYSHVIFIIILCFIVK